MVKLAKNTNQRLNNWVIFIIASALISIGVQFGEMNWKALSVFFVIIGLGSMMFLFNRLFED